MKCRKIKVCIDGFITDIDLMNEVVRISEYIDPNDDRLCNVRCKAQKVERYMNEDFKDNYIIYDEYDLMDYLKSEGDYRRKTKHGYNIGFGNGVKFLIEK